MAGRHRDRGLVGELGCSRREVPIFDSKVAAFYDTKPSHLRGLWPLLWNDLIANADRIGSLATRVRTPDDRPISHLRIPDIVIWDYAVTNC